MRSLRRDGVALFYEEAQGDEPPILLIHGWCGDHTHFAPQFEHFASRDHPVVAVDLRGHGRSDKPHQSYTMQLFADDLAWMCAQIGLEKPVVIGHSMSGVVTLALAMRYPDLPSAIVMVDAPVVRPADARAALPRFLEQLRGADYREVIRGYVSNVLFISSDDQERKERIVQQMSSADFEALGNGETLGGAGVLSDTSGGFLPLEIIGMMGLAVAAVSLVVLMRLVRTS